MITATSTNAGGVSTLVRPEEYVHTDTTMEFSVEQEVTPDYAPTSIGIIDEYDQQIQEQASQEQEAAGAEESASETEK